MASPHPILLAVLAIAVIHVYAQVPQQPNFRVGFFTSGPIQDGGYISADWVQCRSAGEQASCSQWSVIVMSLLEHDF